MLVNKENKTWKRQKRINRDKSKEKSRGKNKEKSRDKNKDKKHRQKREKTGEKQVQRHKNTKGGESMKNYKECLEQQQKELMKLEKIAAENLKGYKGLEKGNIRVSQCNGTPQYRFRKEGTEKEVYLPAYEKEKIKLLVQRDYDEKIYKELKNMRKRLEKFNSNYDVGRIDEMYEKLRDGRKMLINPIKPTEDMLINNWYASIHSDTNSYEKKYEFLTMRGELVRSKSEKIIADFFHSNGIPYVYEPEFILKSGKAKYPDFATLNVKNNKTIYWEHLGKADDEVYAVRNLLKLMDYEESGLIIGENLIITIETRERPLDVRTVKKKANIIYN